MTTWMALASSWDKELAFESAAGDQPVALQPRDLRGTWNSSAFGTLVMRCYTRGDGPRAGERVAPRERRKSDDWYGAYRYHDGVVTGRLAADGVFRGWWLEQPRKVANRKAATGARAEQHRTVVNGGAFAWRGVRRAGEKLIVGCWIYGRSGRADPDKAYDVHPGWDLVPLDGGAGRAEGPCRPLQRHRLQASPSRTASATDRARLRAPSLVTGSCTRPVTVRSLRHEGAA
ncbi:MAG: hypothetical protein ACRDLS_06200 [Solirubrobacteraceae bacterium]